MLLNFKLDILILTFYSRPHLAVTLLRYDGEVKMILLYGQITEKLLLLFEYCL